MKIQTSVRVEDEFCREAKVVFKKVGLSFDDAVNLFLSKVSMEQAIPFSISVPKKDKDDDFTKAQEISMSKTWDNDEDKAWDEL